MLGLTREKVVNQDLQSNSTAHTEQTEQALWGEEVLVSNGMLISAHEHAPWYGHNLHTP